VWLLKVADAVEQWSMTPRQAPVSPTVAVGLLIKRLVPLEDRAVVARALPLLTDDFATATALIREAAERRNWERIGPYKGR
jgi:hypothetical protein